MAAQRHEISLRVFKNISQVSPPFDLFYSFAILCSPLWLMFVLNAIWGHRSFIDPICRNFCMVLSMFYRLVLANFLFSLRNINLTLALLPLRRHVVWRDSVGVESSRSGLKSECADIFHQSFLCCYAILTSPKEGETAVYGYNPALF